MTRRLGRLAILVLATVGAVQFIVTFTPLLSWWIRWLTGPWHEPQGEVLVVLSGSVVEGGMIGESSYWRSVYAVRAWRNGQFRKMVLSGSTATTAPIKDFLLCQGIPETGLEIESRSASTHESAEFTTALVRTAPGRKALLTSDYHMYRAYRAFRKAGLEVIPAPVPDGGKRVLQRRLRWGIFLELAAETVKIVYYKSRGWI